MVERFIALSGGINGDADRFVDGRLTDEVVQSSGTQSAIVTVGIWLGGVDDPSGGRAFIFCGDWFLWSRHTARRRKALRLATARGWSG